jgi:transmembrane sensor
MNSDSSNDGCAITEEAAAWRLTLGAYDSRRVPEFWHWVTRSPAHVREALVMGLLNQVLQNLDPEVVGIPVEAPPPSDVGNAGAANAPPDAARKRKLNPWTFSAATIAACIALILVSAFLFRSPNHKWPWSQTYTTDIGEQRTVALSDGSTLVLDAQSRVRVQLSEHERSFYLLQGQALFNVARDPSRPFRVHTAATTVEAMGTEFNVRTERITTVAVLNGAVRLSSQGSAQPSGQGNGGSAAAPAQLVAGEAVSINGNGDITERTKVDRTTVTAWEQRRLIFSRVSLEDIVREFNRYNRKRHLHVEGKAASLRLGGVFDATDPGPLLLILAKNPSIILEHNGDDVTIRDKH